VINSHLLYQLSYSGRNPQSRQPEGLIQPTEYAERMRKLR
jgi:hypothetical protein